MDANFSVDLFHRIKIDANIYVPIVRSISKRVIAFVCILFGNWFSTSRKIHLQTKENTESNEKKSWKIRQNHEIHFHLSHFEAKSIEKRFRNAKAMKFIATKYF